MATARPRPARASETAEKVHLGRLLLVLVLVALGLAGGAALGFYCYSLNRAYADRRDQAASPTTQASSPPPAPTSVPVSEEQAAVNAAVVRGVRFLKTKQGADGTWPGDRAVGYASLPALTLLECGVPPSDPNVQKAAGFVRTHLGQLTRTYDLSLAVLFLDRLGETQDRERIRTLALRLVAGQAPSGGWDYDCPVLRGRLSPPAPPAPACSAWRSARGWPWTGAARRSGPRTTPMSRRRSLISEKGSAGRRGGRRANPW
jgi:hypothetical protein